MDNVQLSLEIVMYDLVPNVVQPLGLERVEKHERKPSYSGNAYDLYAGRLQEGIYGLSSLGIRGPTSDYVVSLHPTVSLRFDLVEGAVAEMTGKPNISRYSASRPFVRTRGENNVTRVVFLKDGWRFSREALLEELTERAISFWNANSTLESYGEFLARNPTWKPEEGCDRLAMVKALPVGGVEIGTDQGLTGLFRPFRKRHFRGIPGY